MLGLLLPFGVKPVPWAHLRDSERSEIPVSLRQKLRDYGVSCRRLLPNCRVALNLSPGRKGGHSLEARPRANVCRHSWAMTLEPLRVSRAGDHGIQYPSRASGDPLREAALPEPAQGQTPAAEIPAGPESREALVQHPSRVVPTLLTFPPGQPVWAGQDTQHLTL